MLERAHAAARTPLLVNLATAHAAAATATPPSATPRPAAP
jgi:hypothetical protein